MGQFTQNVIEKAIFNLGFNDGAVIDHLCDGRRLDVIVAAQNHDDILQRAVAANERHTADPFFGPDRFTKEGVGGQFKVMAHVAIDEHGHR